MTRQPAHPSSPAPAVLCLAAGAAQAVVIDRARRLGYAVVAVDRDPEAPGFALCDEMIVASTYEAGPILPRLQELQERFHFLAVVNRSSGRPVITAARLARFLGLPGPAPEAAEILTDKARLMAACHAAGFPAPRCLSASSLEQLDHHSPAFPAVVKPALSLVGKSGIRVVHRREDLDEAFAAAAAVSLNGLVNVEEFLPGRDVSLTALVAGGRVRPVLMKDELTAVTDSGGIAFHGVAVPSVFSDMPEQEAILELAGRLAAHFQLDRTVLNLSCRCEPGGWPRIIEVHLDLGGDLFYEGLVPVATDADLLGLFIRFLAGEDTPPPEAAVRPSALIFESGSRPGPGRPYSTVTANSRQELETLIAARLGA